MWPVSKMSSTSSTWRPWMPDESRSSVRSTSGPGMVPLPRSLRACTISTRKGRFSRRIKSASSTTLPISTPTIVSGLPSIVFLDLVGQAANALAELFFGEQGLHGGFLVGCFSEQLVVSRYFRVVAVLAVVRVGASCP